MNNQVVNTNNFSSFTPDSPQKLFLLTMRTLLSVFTTVVFFGMVFSQEENIISKNNVIQLLDSIKKVESSQKDVLYKQAYSFSKKNSNDSLSLEILRKYTLDAIRGKDSIGSRYGFKELNHIYKTKNNQKAKGFYYRLKGRQFRLSARLDSAFYYFNKAKIIFKENNYHSELAKMYNTILVVQFGVKDRVGLERTAIEAHQYFTEFSNYFALAKVYQVQGLSVGEVDAAKAKTLFNKSLSYLDSIEDPYLKGVININVRLSSIYTYIKSNNFVEALIETQKGLDFYKNWDEKLRLEDGYYWLLHNKSVAELELGKVQSGFATIDSVYNYTVDSKDNYSRSFLAKDLAKFHIKYGNQNKGLSFANIALKHAKETNNTLALIETLEILLKNTSYNNKEDFKTLFKLKDSIYKKEREQMEQYALVKFQTDLKEAENLRLKQQNELSNTNLLAEKRRTRVLLLLASIAIICIGSILVIANYRKKNLQFQANLSKAEARENERKKIALNLHDKVVGDLRAVYQKSVNKESSEITEQLLSIKNQIRILSHKLSSIDFDDVSFKDQMINLVSDYYQPNFKIKLHNINDIDWKLVKKEIKRTLFLVCRESIQNSKKHGESTEVVNDFIHHKKSIQLEIRDNGKGFDLSTPRFGIGLKNQKQRVEELNGQFVLESSLNIGTTTSISIPLIA